MTREEWNNPTLMANGCRLMQGNLKFTHWGRLISKDVVEGSDQCCSKSIFFSIDFTGSKQEKIQSQTYLNAYKILGSV